MKHKISTIIKKGNNLDEVADLLIDYLKKSNGPVMYVAGMVTSEGPENIEKNVAVLESWTQKIARENPFIVFSSNDVFGKSRLWKKFDNLGFINQEYVNFWRKILESGAVTDIVMTPRWEISNGARDEHKTAKRHDISIHYLT